MIKGQKVEFGGKTPYQRKLSKGEGMAVFLVKLDGYRDERVTLPIDKNGASKVSLTALTPAQAPSGHKKPTKPGKTKQPSELGSGTMDPFKNP